MKDAITRQVILLFVLLPFLSKCQENKNDFPGKFYWAEINAGYANHGPTGSMTFNFRKDKLLLSMQYNKSHTCIDDHKSEENISSDDNTETHLTVESISALSGIILPGKWNPSFSIGISYTRFISMNTIEIEHDFTVPRIWETILNKDYQEEKLSSNTIYTIGIPAEVKLHFSPKRFIGFDAGIKADFNLHSPTLSAEIGIRFGRIIKKAN